jgi:chromosome transmission fidelity protein 4
MPTNVSSAIALSTSYITVATTSYLRTYTLFGVPVRITRPKATPIITLTSFRDYLFTISAGPLSSTAQPTLTYMLENLRRDTVHQCEDLLPLPPNSMLKSIFFSDAGDPYIYDSTGVLLVLLHWRDPGRARWVPMLDTTQLSRLASGKKQESYFPIAVADNKFHCIILKGGEQYPYFPRPLLSEFDFHVPVTAPLPPSDEAPDSATEATKFEQSHLQTSLLHTLLESQLSYSKPTTMQQQLLVSLTVNINKTLLQLLATECRNGEEKGMKGLEIVQLLQDSGDGKMLSAAEKVCERFGRNVLAEKVREWGEQKLLRLDEDGEALDDEF